MYRLPKYQVGYSLIEILVAVLVISVGLLGVATLQTRGQQFNHFSYLRTQATFLAYDLMDRMRTNATEARNGTYAVNDGNCEQQQPTPDTECDKDTDKCSYDRLAQYDLANWHYMVCDVLPWTDNPPNEVDEACDLDPDYLGDFKKQYKIVWNDSDNEYKIFIQWMEQENKIKCQVWRLSL